MTPDAPPPPLRLAIDYAALTSNWRVLDRLSGKARAGAAIKADGYGLGARGVTAALAGAGCRDFFVAYSSEAAAVADLIDPAQISVLHGPQSLQDAAWIAAQGFRPVINSLAQAALWRAVGGGACDVMVDTGINRLGLPAAELSDPLIGQLTVSTLMSHLASADQDSALNAVQLGRWQQACAQVSHRESSLANSAGIMLGPDYHGDLTRPGLALYGGIERAELAECIRQVVVPQAAIMQIRQIAAGETVGYSATFTAPHAMRVGVVAIGYADGYLRAWSGKGQMHHGAAVLPVLGRVSMDMTVIDLSAAPSLCEGDWVDIDYALPEASAKTGLAQYELLTGLGSRFAR